MLAIETCGKLLLEGFNESGKGVGVPLLPEYLYDPLRLLDAIW
jgi:hypothetical protein